MCSLPVVYTLNAEIPVNSIGEIHVSKLDMAKVSITASGTLVWRAGEYIPGAQGIKSAFEKNGEVIFEVGSGEYSFDAKGSQGHLTCAYVNEHETLSLQCTDTSEKISLVRFASYGTPQFKCGSSVYGQCHAGSSKYIIDQRCLHKNSCKIQAEDWEFRDPCFGTVKKLAVEAICS